MAFVLLVQRWRSLENWLTEMKKIIIILLLCSTCYAQQLPIVTSDGKWLGLYVPSAASVGQLYPAFESATMTGSNAPAPVIIIESGEFNPTYSGWNAFNKDGYASRWYVANVATNWLIYDCGTNTDGSSISNVVSSLSLQSEALVSRFGIFTVSNSMDYLNWTLLLSSSQATQFASWNFGTNVWGRYFKIAVQTYPGGNCQIGEIQLSSADFYNPPMTADNNPSPYIASASTTVGVQSAYYAFDHYDSTFWQTTTTGLQWLALSYGSNVVMNGFTYMPFSAATGGKDYSFERGDGTNWTSMSGGSFAQTTAFRIVTNNNTTAASCYRIVFSNGYTSGNLAIKHWTPKHFR